MGFKLLGLFFNMAGLAWNHSSLDLTDGLPGIGLGQVEFVRPRAKVALPLGFLPVP